MNASIAFHYIYYCLTAGNRHAVHSPFIYRLVSEVLPNKPDAGIISMIENIRKELLKNGTIVKPEDLGAGSRGRIYKERKLYDIVRNSSSPAKYGRLLHNLCLFYRPENVIELGTAAGIGTLYLSTGNSEAKIVTIEGSAAMAGIAENNFRSCGIRNITVLNEPFETGLPRAISMVPRADLVFIDGNHREEPVLRYFEHCLIKSHKYSIFVIDDINWSSEMKSAWKSITRHEKVTATVNLFKCGIAFINPDLSREEFIIRY